MARCRSLISLRAYGYKYDAAGRLNYADFNEDSSGMLGAWFKTSHDFCMSNVTYDVNGNIFTMNQMGTSISGPVFIDKAMVGRLFTSSNYLDIYEGVLNNLTDYTRPRAYINYLVFDQGMNLVPEQSGAVQVSGTPGSWQVIGTSGPITIGQNGYVSIYMSDEQFLPVYMDQLHVTYYRCRLVQEQHYYPFGLPINAVTTSGTLPSQNQIEGNQTHKELGLNQSDFNFRQYDYQIGKFTSIDPLADGYGQESISPYHFAGNNPANFVDPIGLARAPDPSNGGVDTRQKTTIDVDYFTGLNVDAGGLIINGNGVPFVIPGNTETVSGDQSEAPSSDNSSGNSSAAGSGSSAVFISNNSSGDGSGSSNGSSSGAGTTGGVGGDNGGSSKKEGHLIYSGPVSSPYYWNGGGSSSRAPMRLSPEGLDFIQRHEGFGKNNRGINPYNDSKHYATAGYGHLLHKSPYNAADYAKYHNMKRTEARILLGQDIRAFEDAINRMVTVPLTQYQFDAIVSFTFNVGVGDYDEGSGLAGSQFLAALNRGIYDGTLMMHYHKPKKIIGRRQDEVNLFMYGKYQ